MIPKASEEDISETMVSCCSDLGFLHLRDEELLRRVCALKCLLGHYALHKKMPGDLYFCLINSKVLKEISSESHLILACQRRSISIQTQTLLKFEVAFKTRSGAGFKFQG